MKSHRTGWWPLAAVCAVLSGTAAADDSLQEIVVTATLRPTPALEVPASITVRAGALRSAKIAPTANAVSTVRLSPPNTTFAEPLSACTSAGPSAPYSAASAQTANTTGAAVRMCTRTVRGSRISGRRLDSAPGERVAVSRISATPAACTTITPSRTR